MKNFKAANKAGTMKKFQKNFVIFICIFHLCGWRNQPLS